MKRRFVYVIASILAAVALGLAGCSPTATNTTTTTATAGTSARTTAPAATASVSPTPSTEKPQYGGTINTVLTADITNWDPTASITGLVLNLTSEHLWEGDWTKGPAGGYGTSQTDWGLGDNDIFAFKLGYLTDSWKWNVDANGQGTIVYEIKQGVHWALNPSSPASEMVGGREVTADDVVYSFERALTWNLSFVKGLNPELISANISKTGPWEVTIRLPVAAMLSGIDRFGGGIYIIPPEVVKKYGDMTDWRNNVGTGPFMASDYVAGSSVTLTRNPNYWMKNPIGPGKGDQLPYLDGVNVLIITDASTRYAAFRTGKIDQIGPVAWEDAVQIKKQVPDVQEESSVGFQGRSLPIFMRTDEAPFNDIKVRQALNMAIDRQSILNNQYGGIGAIDTFPYTYVKGYDDLYVKLTDSDFPAAAKQLYEYNPDKAKELLTEAGYPNGFKSTLLITTPETDYDSIILGMWSKIGVDVSLVIRDTSTEMSLQAARQYDMTTKTTGPVAVFYTSSSFNPQSNGGGFNASRVTDPRITQALAQLRIDGVSNLNKAMQDYRKILINYVLPEAYVVPDVEGAQYLMWWPWVKNYSGELTVGYDTINWPQFVWLDQGLKKSMGY